MNNVHCISDKTSEWKEKLTHAKVHKVHVYACGYVDDCVPAHIHKCTCAMTRPRQGMPCSCLFHLMRQSQALIDSIYLALTLICRDVARQTAWGPMESVSQLQNVFHVFLCRNKGVQTCIHSSSKRSPILSRLHVSSMRLCWHLILKSGSKSFPLKYSFKC